MAQKIHHRRYHTSYSKLKISSGGSNLCLKGYGHVGTLFHMLWSCLHIRSYWKSIFRLLDNWYPCHVDHAVLNINIDFYQIHFRTIFVNILAVAQLMVLKKWKSSVILQSF